ncbi:MAG TPA: hypothetical protein GXX17_07255 [Clostridiales bacterium]|nr:hypothetical protein [Clostridiales bacterium]
MADYDSREFERMQMEAVARAREMHKRSRLEIPSEIPPMPSFVRTPYSNRQANASNSNATPANQPSKVEEVKDNKTSGRTGFDILKMLNFKNIEIDTDRALLLLLFILLSSEGCDELLLLSLLYIIL